MDTDSTTQEAVLLRAYRGRLEISNGVRVRSDVIASSKEQAQEIIAQRAMCRSNRRAVAADSVHGSRNRPNLKECRCSKSIAVLFRRAALSTFAACRWMTSAYCF